MREISIIILAISSIINSMNDIDDGKRIDVLEERVIILEKELDNKQSTVQLQKK